MLESTVLGIQIREHGCPQEFVLDTEHGRLTTYILLRTQSFDLELWTCA